MKTCSTCKTIKDEAEFSKNRSKKHGLEGVCKKCIDAAYKSNSGPKLKRARERYRLHPEKTRINTLRKKYGLSPEQWDVLFASQGGLCAICGRAPKKPSVDHNHVTGKVRGILCDQCNTAIGFLKDSPANAFSAGNYLLKHT